MPAEDLQHLHRVRRRLATVFVDGLEPLGLGVAEQLTGEGLGVLLLRDDAPIAATDIPQSAEVPARRSGPCRYRPVDRGAARVEVARRMLTPARTDQQSTLVMEVPEESSVPGADLHLVIGSRAQSPDYLRDVAATGVPVLPLSVSDGCVRLGPLLGPCAGPYAEPHGQANPESMTARLCCAECLSHYGMRHLPATDSVADSSAGVIVPGSLAALISSTVAHQVQVLVDGDCAAAVEQGMLVIDAASGITQVISLTPHPECACLMTRTVQSRTAQSRTAQSRTAQSRTVPPRLASSRTASARATQRGDPASPVPEGASRS